MTLRFEPTKVDGLESVYQDDEYLGTVHLHEGKWSAAERVHVRERGKPARDLMMGDPKDTKHEAAQDLVMFAAAHKRQTA